MQILSTTSYTPDGNKYQETRKCALIGAAAGIASSVAKDTLTLVNSKELRQQNKFALGAIIATGALFYGAIGKIIGSIIDDRKNIKTAEQIDIKNELEKKELLAQIIAQSKAEECNCPACREVQECDCPDCSQEEIEDIKYTEE